MEKGVITLLVCQFGCHAGPRTQVPDQVSSLAFSDDRSANGEIDVVEDGTFLDATVSAVEDLVALQDSEATDVSGKDIPALTDAPSPTSCPKVAPATAPFCLDGTCWDYPWPLQVRYLTGVAGNSQDDAWLASAGVLLHRLGSQWLAPANAPTATVAVTADDVGGTWAIDDHLSLFHTAGIDSWSQVSPPMPQDVLTPWSIQLWDAPGPSAAWISDGGGVFAMWDGQSWTALNNPDATGKYWYLRDFHPNSPSSGFGIAEYDGVPSTIRLCSKGACQALATFEPGEDPEVFLAVNTTSAVMAGTTITPTGGIKTWSWDGATLKKSSLGINWPPECGPGFLKSAKSEVPLFLGSKAIALMAVHAALDSPCTSMLGLQNGTGWTWQPVYDNSELHLGRTGPTVWYGLQHVSQDGNSLCDVFPPGVNAPDLGPQTKAGPTVIQGLSTDDLWLAAKGAVLRNKGGAWHAISLGKISDAYKCEGVGANIFVAGPEDIFFANGKCAAHYQNGVWTSDYETYGRLAGTGPDDVWMIGEGVAHWNGTTWEAPFMMSPDFSVDCGLQGCGMQGLYAGGKQDIWAVGFNLKGIPKDNDLVWHVKHWTGGFAWLADATTATTDIGTFNSIHGSAPDNVWMSVFGNNLEKDKAQRHVLRWDGKSWQEVPTQGKDIWGHLWVRAKDDVYVLQPHRLWHWNGAGWTSTHVPAHAPTSIWEAGGYLWFSTDYAGVLKFKLP
jgi:hypothetical protein